jgi:signal transduction histidine kinase
MESMADSRPADRRISIRSEFTQDGKARLSIRDDGGGLSPTDADRVFDPFYTTKPGGIGLGLTISRTIVESHGGRLTVAPNNGPGVTFSFELPVFRGELTP